VIKYNLTKAAFIWDVFGNAFSQVKDKYDLLEKLNKPPFNIIVPPNNRSTEERYQKLKRNGLTVTRKEAQQRREIRKEMEESYVKEGEDIWKRGD
jgi:hypothetical protein